MLYVLQLMEDIELCSLTDSEEFKKKFPGREHISSFPGYRDPLYSTADLGPEMFLLLLVVKACITMGKIVKH